MEEMNRREFLTGAAAAVGLGATPESTEAFGAMSPEKYGEIVDTIIISEELGGEETRQAIKDSYKEASSGQRLMFGMMMNCSETATRVLQTFDSSTGSIEVTCQ